MNFPLNLRFPLVPKAQAEPADAPDAARRPGLGPITGRDLSGLDSLVRPFVRDPFNRLRPPFSREAAELSLELASMAYTLDLEPWAEAGWNDFSIQIDDALQSGLTHGTSADGERIRALINTLKVRRAKAALRERNPVSQVMSALRQRERSDTIKAVCMMHPLPEGRFLLAIGFMGTGKRFYDWISNFRFTTEEGFHKGFYQLCTYFEEGAESIVFPATAQALGFKKPTDNSMDSVSDRDYVIELLSALSILMMHLSRFSEEIILWCSWEFKFVDLDDAYSTGSSIMPQKKNPDVAELVRGKTGRVYGDLVTLLTMMKGLPLAYNKDMQEDKEALFDAVDTVELCLPVFAAMVDTLTVRPKNMAKAAAGGFINATDCADYLVKKGLPFREAYMIVGRLVNLCIKTGDTLDTLTLKDFRAISGLFDEDVYKALELKTCVNGRSVYGGPARESVEKQISNIEGFLAQRS